MAEKKAPPSTVAKVRDVFTKFGELSDKVVFGDVWERKELSKRDRSLVTIAALIATAPCSTSATRSRWVLPHGVRSCACQKRAY